MDIFHLLNMIFLKVLPKEARQGGNGARPGEIQIGKDREHQIFHAPVFLPFFAPMKCVAFNALGPYLMQVIAPP